MLSQVELVLRLYSFVFTDIISRLGVESGTSTSSPYV